MFWLGGGITRALFAVRWAFAYQAPTAVLVAWVVLRQHVADRLSGRNLALLAAFVGVGQALVFAAHLWLGVLFVALLLPETGMRRPYTPGLALFPAAVISWWFVAHLIERWLDPDLETTQRLTGAICLPTWLVWLVVGLAVIFITDPSARPW